jgi:nitrate reductase (cytochrome), electron transfer subunit
MMMKKILLAIGIFLMICVMIIHTQAQQNATTQLDVSAPDGIRPGGTLSQELPAPKIPREKISAEPGHRNYPEQPPTIPHSIRNYQIDKNFNMCLTCHSRSASPQTGAPMISVTHFYDRDGQVLAAVSPRRYFCLQCHVPQADVKPARTNDFKSIDTLLQNKEE